MSNQKFQLSDLVKKGFRLNESTGRWEKSFGTENNIVSTKGRPSNDVPPICDTMHFESNWRRFTIGQLPKGLNGSGGLMQMHWSKYRIEKEKWNRKIADLMIPPIEGPIKVVYTRMSSKLMDWDNMCSSFKIIGDALVKAGVIKDDNPEIITEFVPRQEKVQRKSQGVSVFIIKIE